MPGPKKPTPEEEAFLASKGLSILDLARDSDRFAKAMARRNYGPYMDEDEPDVIEQMEMAAGMRVAMSAMGPEDE